VASFSQCCQFNWLYSRCFTSKKRGTRLFEMLWRRLQLILLERKCSQRISFTKLILGKQHYIKNMTRLYKMIRYNIAESWMCCFCWKHLDLLPDASPKFS